MKDIKTFLKGFLTCLCLLLIMGATKKEQVGRYQAFVGIQSENLVDTVTGEIWYYRNHGKDKKWIQYIAPLKLSE